MNRTRARVLTPLAVMLLTGLTAPLAYAESTRRVPRAQTNNSIRRVVVSLTDRKLAVIENGDVLRVFAVSVGAPNSPSPVGTFTIVNRITHPTYYRPGKVIGPGPANPLGTRWLGFDQKGYGIHGTDDPKSIGHARSHGCIRLRNQDVEELFDLLRAGDVVELRVESFAETLGEVRSAGL
jgi:lipoprotein-anchoring transpeptidase ErfK/SrfK